MTRIHKLLLAALMGFSLTVLAADKVNINTADAETLAATLNGVGPAKAEAIVAYRDQHGPFKNVAELAEVKGIGRSTVEKNHDLILLK